MPLVYYVGYKPKRVDTVAGTGVTWEGRGDSKEVADAVWAKLSNHPDIWSLEKPALEAADLPKLPEKPRLPTYALQHADGSVLDLTAMDDKALHAFADENGLKVEGKKKGDALRAAIVDAVKAAAAGA